MTTEKHRSQQTGTGQHPRLPPCLLWPQLSSYHLSSHPALLPPSQSEPLRGPRRPPDFRSPPSLPRSQLPWLGLSPPEYRSPGRPVTASTSRAGRGSSLPLHVPPLAVSSRVSVSRSLPLSSPPDKVGAGRWGPTSLRDLVRGFALKQRAFAGVEVRHFPSPFSKVNFHDSIFVLAKRQGPHPDPDLGSRPLLPSILSCRCCDVSF